MDPNETYKASLWACTVLFLVSVPVLLSLRAWQANRMPWWLVVVRSSLAGWISSNIYALVEDRYIREAELEALKHDSIVDFFVRFPTPEFALRYAWIFGLVYLLCCLGLYRLFRENKHNYRALIGLATVAIALAVFSRIPPWCDFEILTFPFQFGSLYVFFLLLASISLQILRYFRLRSAWSAFAVTFLLVFLIRLANWQLFKTIWILHPDWLLAIREEAEWTAMYAAVFTALWFISIRVPASQPSG